MTGPQHKQIGENIGQRNKRTTDNKKHQAKTFNTTEAHHVHTRQTSDAQTK